MNLQQLQETTHFNTKCSICGNSAQIAKPDSFICRMCYDASHAFPLLSTLRATSHGNTRMLYHLSFWDGPHSGVMLWNGSKAFFQSTSEFVQYGVEICSKATIASEKIEFAKLDVEFRLQDIQEILTYRPFNVYAIPEDNMQVIEAAHENFRNHVGTHTDYDPTGKRGCGATSKDVLGDLKPYTEHSKFYNTTQPKPIKALHLPDCKIIGYFRLE